MADLLSLAELLETQECSIPGSPPKLTDFEPEPEPDPHMHCATCISSKCMFASCKLIWCKECRHPHHQCKASEHNLLCSHQKVLCINAGNGCDVIMPRSQLGVHLASCPASVVMCPLDWSRTTTDFTANSSLEALPTKVVGLDNSKLDILFAVRDYDNLLETLSHLSLPIDLNDSGKKECLYNMDLVNLLQYIFLAIF